MMLATSEAEQPRQQNVQQTQHSGTPQSTTTGHLQAVRSLPRKLTKRIHRPRSPSLPIFPSSAAADVRVHALTPTHIDQPLASPMPKTRGGRLLRTLSLRSSESRKERNHTSAPHDDRRSSASLWPPQWSFSSLVRRHTAASPRPSSAHASTTTLATHSEFDMCDYDESTPGVNEGVGEGQHPRPAPQFLPLIRVVSPLTVTLERSSVDQRDRESPKSPQEPPSQYEVNDATQPGPATGPRPADPSRWSSVALEHKDVVHQPKLTRPKFTLDAYHDSTDDLPHDVDAPGVSPMSQNVTQNIVEACADVEAGSSSHPQFHLPLRLNPVCQASQTSMALPTSPSSGRPTLTRRVAALGPEHGVSRKFTFAMAMTDDDITDEALVNELERIRAVRTLSSGAISNPSSGSSSAGGQLQDLEYVWDLDAEQSDLELEFDTEQDLAHREPSPFLLDEETGVCDSPASEPAEEPWPQTLRLKSEPTGRLLSSSTSLSAQMQHLPPPPRSASEAQISSTTPGSWSTTRHALLTCRELVRTERHYLASLITLLSCETSTPPPPLMLHYAAVLVDATKKFVERMERHPTPSGVAKAFITSEAELDAAYVGWCGVVGTWFSGDSEQGKGSTSHDKGKRVDHHSQRTALRRLSKVRAPAPPAKTPDTLVSPSSSSCTSSAASSTSTSSSGSESSTSGSTTSATSVTSSTFTSPSTSPVNSNATIPSLNNPLSSFTGPNTRSGKLTKAKTISAPPSRTPSFIGRMHLDELIQMYASNPSQAEPPLPLPPPPSFNKLARKPLVRDLAILPTQRVMRYVLLFRDLLSNTEPTNSTRPFVEKAAELADRIAKKCDRAQNNAAFIITTLESKHLPSSPSGSSTPASVSKATASSSTTSKSIEQHKDRRHSHSLTKKLTKSKGHHSRQHSQQDIRASGVFASTPEMLANALVSVEKEKDKAGHDVLVSIQQDDGSLIRRRSQSYTNVATDSAAAHALPKSSSHQRLSMLNFSMSIGGLWGRSHPPETRSSHPPSSFNARALANAALS